MWYITLIEVENESFILNGTNADILNLFQLEPKVKTDWGLVGDINNETNKILTLSSLYMNDLHNLLHEPTINS